MACWRRPGLPGGGCGGGAARGGVLRAGRRVPWGRWLWSIISTINPVNSVAYWLAGQRAIAIACGSPPILIGWPPTLERRDAASELVTPKYDGLPVRGAAITVRPTRAGPVGGGCWPADVTAPRADQHGEPPGAASGLSWFVWWSTDVLGR